MTAEERDGEREKWLERREQGPAAVQVQVALEQQRLAALPDIEQKVEAQGPAAQGPYRMEFGAHKGKTLQFVREFYRRKWGKVVFKKSL